MAKAAKPVRLAVAAFFAAWVGGLAPALPLFAPADAEARAGSRGYSRPSVRTPPLSAPSASGYRRPSAGGGGFSTPRGGADLELSRRGSAEALQRYRASQEPMRRPSARAPSTRTSEDWSSRRGWTPPPYARQGSGLGGLGNTVLLWFLLDSLTRPGHAQYFHDHQNDPNVQAWRREADARASSDPELRAKLNQLDAELAAREDQPRNPNAPPPDRPNSGSNYSVVAIALLGCVLAVLWQARRRRGPLDLAKNMARAKLGGASGARATPYRLGMTVTLDPTPFVLGGSALKVRPPAGELASVTALGRLEGALSLERLYLPEGFFQLHRRGAMVDECRWFSPLDQFTPADEQEWAFWLDGSEGLIGWPTFETKDGRLYQRAWSPGGQRMAPRQFTEQVTEIAGTTSRRLSAMLYAAPTQAAPPAPEFEYVLVAAVEDGAQAWVEIHAGIDVNPSSLSLPA